MKRLIAFLVLSFSQLALPCRGYFPPHKLTIPDSVTGFGITREQYEAVIDKMNAIFVPVVEAQGARLVINRAWQSGTVNASTSRNRDGDRWTINFYGGMARHRDMTEDGFALVYCHELGHHLGGAPKKKNNTYWASTEGQSDYWGTLKCLRRAFEMEDNETIIQSMTIPEEVTKKCMQQFNEKSTTALCKRMGMAAYALGKMHADLRDHEEPPKFETPDMREVNRTYEAHPQPQCRMDTQFQGALCELGWQTEVSQVDELLGTCHSSAGHLIGNRPLCWFKPKL